MTTSMRRGMVAVGIAGAILLAGCGQDDPAEFDDPGASESAADSTVEPGDAASDDSAAQGSSADDVDDAADGEADGARLPDPKNVVVEDVFTAPNSERDTVRVGIEGIIVTEQTMELRLVLTPEDGGDGLRVWDVLREEANVDARLIDRENLKEYSVLRSAGSSEPYMPSSQARLTAGQSLGFPIFYAPPEDDIDTVDVQLSSELPIFEDVPLTFQE